MRINVMPKIFFLIRSIMFNESHILFAIFFLPFIMKLFEWTF